MSNLANAPVSAEPPKRAWVVPPGLQRPTETKRRSKASALHADGLWLKQEGLFDAVCARLSPEAAKTFANPPLVTQWIDPGILDEVYEAVHALRGYDAVAEMSRFGVNHSLSALARPLLTMFLRLSGSTPASIFAHLNTITGSFGSGMNFHWVPADARSGELYVVYAQPMRPSLYHAWAGVALAALDFCKVAGSVVVETSPDRSIGRIAVQWAEAKVVPTAGSGSP